MERDSRAYREGLFRQIEEAYGKVVYTYTCHLKCAAHLAKRAHRFKWTQIILSAITTGSFLTTLIADEWIAAVFGALCSTGLLAVNSYLKDIDLASNRQEHVSVANQLWSIREAYISLLTDFKQMSDGEIRERRDALSKRTEEVYEIAPQTDSKSYTETQEALKNQEEQFFTREELNQLLPSHLRS